MTSNGIKGKIFVVSGAASGIGRATAIRLAELGASGLSLSDVDAAGLEETRQLCKSFSRGIEL
jgi:NAD(P)-dependent dehydrogenase (short-subunit alcohol dehydrogenase family)